MTAASVIMSNRYGLTEAQRTLSTQPFDMWSGAFMSIWEASGTGRTGARSVTLTTYNGDKVKVHLPDGVTFPRTAENYCDIDAALSDALAAFYLRSRTPVESEEDYALVCDAMYAADPSNRCQHDNGTEDIEGVEVCDVCGETVEDYA